MEAKKKELEARRAAAATKATKTFYKITVKVAHLDIGCKPSSPPIIRCMRRSATCMAASLAAGAVCFFVLSVTHSHSMYMLAWADTPFAMAKVLA